MDKYLLLISLILTMRKFAPLVLACSCLTSMLVCAMITLTFGQASRVQYGILPTTPLQECSVDQWTGDNGLLSNNLTSVVQASTGFLWITTNNGLMRFDGSRLEVFDQGVIPFLSTDAFYRVYEDKNGTLWFASRGNGIVRFSNNKFEQHLPLNPLIPKSLRTMLIEDDGTMWVGSDYKGLILIRDTTAEKIPHPILDDVSILSLEKDNLGALYIGTNSKGLLKYDKGIVEQIAIQGTYNHSVNVIKSVGGGVLFVGTTQGLYKIEDGVASSVPMLDNIQINHLIQDSFGSLWIGTERGLARINERHNVREFLRSGRSFAGAHITSLFLDNEGSLWFSTGKSGLLRLKESPIRNFNEQHGLSVDRVNVVHEGVDGKFYVCLDDGFINVIEDDKIAPFPVLNKRWNESVRDIHLDKNGTFWIASYNGLMKKTKQSETIFTTNNGLPSNSVRRIFRDSRSDLWIGTRAGGIVQFRDDKVQKIFNRQNGLSSDYILAIEEDKHGRLLIGTHSGGLNILNPDGSIEIYHLKEDDDGVLIFNLDVDDAEQIWLATSIGLYHFNLQKKTFTRVALTDVVKGESYFDWVEDKRGNVWIPTNIGIIQITKSDVLKFLSGDIASVKSKIFNDFDGMKNKECTGATRSLLASTGEIWVPTIAGICVVDPERQRENKMIPPVYITEVITDDHIVPNPSGKVEVEPGNFRITIHFTSLSLLAPSKVRFKYKLDRVDGRWKELSPGKRSVDYTSLPPGDYTFSVLASNNDGVWNEEGTNLAFVVRPFFYQSAWFYVGLVIILLMLFYLIYKWRVNAIEVKNAELIKVNSELDRFVYSASHDLRAPLASILGLVKLTKLDNDPKNRMEYLEMVERSIHKLDGFIHDIINYSRNARTELESRKVDFNVLIKDILTSLQFQEKSNRIRKDVQVQGEGEFYTDPKRLEIILFNLITNAIKYHKIDQPDPYVVVRVNYSDYDAVIEVIDNGIGIDRNHQESIFKMFYRADERSNGSGLGLFIAKETVEKLRGTLSVHSVVGKGSTFRFKVPSLNVL